MRVVAAADAARAITAAVLVQPSLRMALHDARGHVLAEDVIAPIDLPPWTNAGMDGYAARADDFRGAVPEHPVRLRINESIAAGGVPGKPVRPGETARIFTGAALPDGADSVIRQEDTTRDGEFVVVLRDRDAQTNIRLAGSDLARGALALGAGTVLGGPQIAVLAALAVAHPVVHRRPRIGVLTSGDEIVSHDHPEHILSRRRLSDVNSPALTALVEEAGAIAVQLGIARDDAGELERIVRAIDDIDLLITAGGVSVGEHDHIRAVMELCSVRTLFDRVRMRPGGPATFGIFPNGKPWLALPGNPVSAMVTFELFARPAIRAMAGHRNPFRRVIPALLRDGVRRDTTLDQYVRCTFDWPADGSPPIATLTGAQGSGMLMSMVRAEGLAIVPAGNDPMTAGSRVDAILFTPP